MPKYILLAASAIALAAATPSAQAAGAFDFLDPCIAARDDLSQQTRDVAQTFAQAEGQILTAAAPDGFLALWMRVKKEQARPYFDSDVSPMLVSLGVTDIEAAYEMWFRAQIESVDPEQLRALIDENYRQVLREELAVSRTHTEEDANRARDALNSQCKNDVGSQVLRVVMSPIGWIAGNFEAGKDEANIVTQVFRAVTGISLADIGEFGLLGGPNSELRRALNAVVGGENSAIREGLRFFDPGNTNGIFGGPNSFFRKPFG